MSLWKTLEHKKKPAGTQTSFNLFTTLKERARVENLRPDAIDFAHLERVSESGIIQKSSHIEIKKNLLNINYYVLKNPHTTEYFRIDEREKFLWEHMDGMHTIRDLALAYYNEYGAFAYDKIVELVYDLRRKTFLTEPEVAIFKKLSIAAQGRQMAIKLVRLGKALLYWEVPVFKVDWIFTLLYRYIFRIFFSPFVATILLSIACVGFVSFIFVSTQQTATVFVHNESVTLGVILLLVLNFASLFLHEIAHGVGTKHYGRVVHKAGFLLYFFWPSFYVDTTDMWMEPRKNRIMVSLVGPFTEMVIAGVVSIALFLSPSLPLGDIWYKFALVSYLSIFVNLNPLVEWDGYFVLMDILGIPCLRLRSLHFIRHTMMSKLRTKEPFSRVEILYSVFGSLSAIWSTLAVVLGFRFWRRHLVGILSI